MYIFCTLLILYCKIVDFIWPRVRLELKMAPKVAIYDTIPMKNIFSFLKGVKQGQTEQNRAERIQTRPNRAKQGQTWYSRAKQCKTGPYSAKLDQLGLNRANLDQMGPTRANWG